jgi:hypothetical protein
MIISYEIDYSELLDFVEKVKKRFQDDNLGHFAESIKTAGQYAVQEWIRTANSKFDHSEGEYVRGILEGIEYPYNGNPLEVVIQNKVKHAAYLERGVNPFDLKKMLMTSSKVRINKKGERYLVIPFRHGIPNSVTFRSTMDSDTYKEAKNLRASVIAGTYKEGVVQRGTPLEQPIPSSKVSRYVNDAEFLRNNNPTKVIRNKYIWGERLEASGKFDGMVRFEKNVNMVREEIISQTALGKFTYSRFKNVTTNNKMYSHYLTFRVMREGSQGWQHKGIKAKNILKETKQRIEQPIMMMLKEGIQKDLQELGFEKK